MLASITKDFNMNSISAGRPSKMVISETIRAELSDEWIPDIYREKVKSQRTRSFELNVPAKENAVEIVHTLLGIQIKTGKKMIGCPDLRTARYLRVFARLGCSTVAVPYDITGISSIADELESSWHKTLLLFEKDSENELPQTKGRRRAALIRAMRNEIEAYGAGGLMPLFDTETMQRKK